MSFETILDYGIFCTRLCSKYYYALYIGFLVFVLITLSLVGGIVFQVVEAPPETRITEAIIRQRDSTLRQLRTKIQNGETKAEVTLFIQLYEGQYIGAIRNGTVILNGKEDPLWTFEGSVYYCLTTFSLVGYGNLAPKTNLGRAIAIIYCGFTIPVTSLILGELGELLLLAFDFLWLKICFRTKPDKSSKIGQSQLQLNTNNANSIIYAKYQVPIKYSSHGYFDTACRNTYNSNLVGNLDKSSLASSISNSNLVGNLDKSSLASSISNPNLVGNLDKSSLASSIPNPNLVENLDQKILSDKSSLTSNIPSSQIPDPMVEDLEPSWTVCENNTEYPLDKSADACMETIKYSKCEIIGASRCNTRVLKNKCVSEKNIPCLLRTVYVKKFMYISSPVSVQSVIRHRCDERNYMFTLEAPVHGSKHAHVVRCSAACNCYRHHPDVGHLQQIIQIHIHYHRQQSVTNQDLHRHHSVTNQDLHRHQSVTNQDLHRHQSVTNQDFLQFYSSVKMFLYLVFVKPHLCMIRLVLAYYSADTITLAHYDAKSTTLAYYSAGVIVLAHYSAGNIMRKHNILSATYSQSWAAPVMSVLDFEVIFPRSPRVIIYLVQYKVICLFLLSPKVRYTEELHIRDIWLNRNVMVFLKYVFDSPFLRGTELKKKRKDIQYQKTRNHLEHLSYLASDAVHRFTSTNYVSVPRDRFTSNNSASVLSDIFTSNNSAPVPRDRFTSNNSAPVLSDIFTSNNSAPVPSDRFTSNNSAPVPSDRFTSNNSAPVPSDRFTSNNSMSVPSHVQLPYTIIKRENMLVEKKAQMLATKDSSLSGKGWFNRYRNGMTLRKELDASSASSRMSSERWYVQTDNTISARLSSYQRSLLTVLSIMFQRQVSLPDSITLFWLGTPFRYIYIGKRLGDGIRKHLNNAKTVEPSLSNCQLLPSKSVFSASKQHGSRDRNTILASDGKDQNNNVPDDDDEESDDDDDESSEDVVEVKKAASEPVLLTIATTFIFLSTGSLFLTKASSNMSYFDSFWFFFISVVTIGYGDVVPTDQVLFVFLLLYIFIGLCLMSNLIGETSVFFSANASKSKAIAADAVAIINTRKQLIIVQKRVERANHHWAIVRDRVRTKSIPLNLIEEAKKYKAGLLVEERELIRWAYKIYFKQEQRSTRTSVVATAAASLLTPRYSRSPRSSLVSVIKPEKVTITKRIKTTLSSGYENLRKKFAKKPNDNKQQSAKAKVFLLRKSNS